MCELCDEETSGIICHICTEVKDKLEKTLLEIHRDLDHV